MKINEVEALEETAAGCANSVRGAGDDYPADSPADGGLAALILWGTSVDPAGAPPFALVLVLMGMPAVVIGGVVLALFQRIQEIGKGEEDDARQF